LERKVLDFCGIQRKASACSGREQRPTTNTKLYENIQKERRNPMIKYIFQYLLASALLLFSTFAAWYEGSEIRDDPWEWKYSAFFSKMFNGEITNSADISQLDHFIYAAKFSPIYPTFIIVSLSYILILSLYLLLKRYKRSLIVLLFSFGILYLLLGLTVADSPTIGGKYFMSVFIAIGILNFIMSFLFYLKFRRNGKIVSSSLLN
jgi:hypothetical protein